jgi:hypothetical protein
VFDSSIFHCSTIKEQQGLIWATAFSSSLLVQKQGGAEGSTAGESRGWQNMGGPRAAQQGRAELRAVQGGGGAATSGVVAAAQFWAQGFMELFT